MKAELNDFFKIDRERSIEIAMHDALRYVLHPYGVNVSVENGAITISNNDWFTEKEIEQLIKNIQNGKIEL